MLNTPTAIQKPIFFAGNPLNRLSWLRTSHPFLNALIASPAAHWIIFNGGQPLVSQSSSSSSMSTALEHLSTDDVRSLLGPQPFFGQGQGEGQLVPVSVKELASVRHRGTRVVFLGLLQQGDEDGPESENRILSQSGSKDAIEEAVSSTIEGTPFFSMDVADIEPERVDAVLKSAAKSGEVLSWMDARAVIPCLNASVAGIYAQARSMVDWNERNKFCPACSAPSYSMWGGWKISCSTLLPWFDRTGRKPCISERGLHNFTHPRTDAVVIMVAIDSSGDKILLGRNKKFPEKFFSALAGFIEPGESLEDAVKREMWEEAGVKVWDVRYHSSQPWPYPANLMIGFYATADSSKPIRTDLDNELEEARWYSREEVLAILRQPQGTKFSPHDQRRFAEKEQGLNSSFSNTKVEMPTLASAAAAALAHSDPALQARELTGTTRDKVAMSATLVVEYEEVLPFRLPPLTAIAGVLIRDWSEGKASRVQGSTYSSL